MPDAIMSRAKVVAVVGVSFVPGYPDNLYALVDHDRAVQSRGERLAAILVRRPDNPYDANAVEVHIPALGRMAMIGHVDRDNAARLAPHLDAGVRFHAELVGLRVHPDHLDRPGIDIAISRVEMTA